MTELLDSTCGAPTIAPSRPSGKSHAGPRLRILHLVSSLKVGGLEQFALHLASWQRTHGCEVRVLGLQGGPLQERATAMGLDAHALDAPGRLGRITRGLAEMAGFQADLIHVHNPGPIPYALLAKSLLRNRVVMTRHGQDTRRVVGHLRWRLVDAVVAVSQDAGRAMQGSGIPADRVSVILNGVEPQAPVRARQAMRTELALSDELAGVIVARIDRLKGHDILVAALALLAERGTRVSLLVAGDGPDRERIEQLARESGLTGDRLKFLGFRRDVPDLLAAADFFVLPSRTEGLPLSVLEAMTHGLPVIATPVGGVPEVVRDGVDGLLVPVDDAAALADAMERLAGSTLLRQRLGTAGRRRALDEFSFDEMARRYDRLYQSLCR